MNGAHFVFNTSAFSDPPDTLAQNVNAITGHSLAVWLSEVLKRDGISASDVWAEDHGWDFSVSLGGATYICACCVHVEEGAATHEAQVTFIKMRSIRDRLFGKNKYMPNDPLAAAIFDVLSRSPEIKSLARNDD